MGLQRGGKALKVIDRQKGILIPPNSSFPERPDFPCCLTKPIPMVAEPILTKYLIAGEMKLNPCTPVSFTLGMSLLK